MTRDEDETERAWQEIVAHYGERPTLAAGETPAEADETSAPATEPDPYAMPEEPVLSEDAADDAPQFRPPPPPPVPFPRTWQRALAWAGLVLAPVLALLVALTPLGMPTQVGMLVLLWGVGGFVYLAVFAPRDPRDPWDDGSRV